MPYPPPKKNNKQTCTPSLDPSGIENNLNKEETPDSSVLQFHPRGKKSVTSKNLQNREFIIIHRHDRPSFSNFL